MDARERIADYLSGDLSPDEQAAFEAALVGDAALRADVAAARRADTALGALPPTALPDGFEDRLRAHLAADLDAVLRPSDPVPTADPLVAAEAELGRHDELAARRDARERRRWTGLAGAAAAVLAVAGVVGALSGIGGGAGDRDMAAGEAETADDSFGTMTAPDDATEESYSTEADQDEDAPASGEGDDVAADAPQAADESDGSVALHVGGRDLDAADLDDLLGGPEVRAFAAERLAADTAAAQRASRESSLLFRFRRAAEATGAADAADTDEDAALDGAQRDAVEACLQDATGGGGVPVYAELATYQGRDVLALALVTEDPGTGRWTVPGVRVLDLDSCAVVATRP